MGPMTLALALGLGGGLAYLVSKNKQGAGDAGAGGRMGPGDLPPKNAAGIRPAITTASVKGPKSGVQWDVGLVRAPAAAGGETLSQVIFKSGLNTPAAPHMVLVFSQVGSDKESRRLVEAGATTGPLLQAAMADFGVKPRQG